ncbi:MAG: hypothetical protein ACWA5P_02050 [bacterium]
MNQKTIKEKLLHLKTLPEEEKIKVLEALLDQITDVIIQQEANSIDTKIIKELNKLKSMCDIDDVINHLQSNFMHFIVSEEANNSSNRENATFIHQSIINFFRKSNK